MRTAGRELSSLRRGTPPSQILRFYSKMAAQRLLDRLFRRQRWRLYNRRHLMFRGRRRAARLEGACPEGLEALLSTTSGLLLFRDGQITRLLRGRFTGLTRRADRVYLAEELFETKRSRILSCRLRDGIVSDLQHHYAVQGSGGFHQIDFIGERLFVTDTHNNRVAVLDASGRLLNRIYPNCVHSENRPNVDPDERYYGHFNSVFRWQGHIYILANNRTQNTGKPSVLYRLDEDDYTRVERLAGVPAGENSHNVLITDEGTLICDSKNGALIRDGEAVFQTSLFTRGLAMNDDLVLLGGSELADRYHRAETSSRLWILDRRFRRLAEVDLGRCGQLYDVRLTSRDYGLSNEAAALQEYEVGLEHGITVAHGLPPEGRRQ